MFCFFKQLQKMYFSSFDTVDGLAKFSFSKKIILGGNS